MYFYPSLCISLWWLCIHLFFIGSLKLNNTSFFFCETSVLYERNFLIIKSPMKTFISVLSILSTHTLTHPHTHPHVIFSLPIQYSALSYTACFCHDSYISIQYIIIKCPYFLYLTIISYVDEILMFFKVEAWSWQMKKMSSTPH